MSKKNIAPINEKIRAEEVMLIGVNGEKVGILPFSEALKSASSASLDLVQVSPNGENPVVCKLLDYGNHLFDKKKSSSLSKVKVKRNTTKEIKFRPSTDVGDYNIKLKKIKKNDIIYWKGHVAIALSSKKLIHAYGPMKKTVIMGIDQTIKLIERTAKLKVIGIKRL